MADEDINKAENFMNNLNRLGQANQNEDIDEILSGLLSSSISATPAEDLNDLDDISCGEISNGPIKQTLLILFVHNMGPISPNGPINSSE